MIAFVKNKACNFSLKKGIIIPLLFFLFVETSYARNDDDIYPAHLIKDAVAANLHNSPVWKSLLHVSDGKLNIADPNFILSKDNFSLKNELEQTIFSFFGDIDKGDSHGICKFPARFFWIKSELNLGDDIFPHVQCSAFDEYLKKAPADEISLVFVSENVSNPSSMMGHVFLKLSGYNFKSNYVEHAVSFFTIIDTFNIPYLILKSTIIGMEGFFSLLPFNEHIDKYLIEEKRNVWEYRLKLSENNKKLMYYHIWELKGLQMKYFFTGYNCATVIHNILSLSSENFSKKNYLWITPKDVAKEAYQNKLISDSKLIPSDAWYIRMLSDTVDSDTQGEIHNLFKNKSFDTIDNQDLGLYERELVKSYASYLYNEQRITKEELDTVNRTMNESFEKNEYDIDLSEYKSPLNTYDDSQLNFGYKRKKDKNYLKLNLLPASNTLSDDNREYFNEYMLKLGEISLLYRDGKIDIESFQLYAMKTLIPWNRFAKGISGEFRLGLEEHRNKELEIKKSVNVAGGVGLTKKLTPDISVYFLWNGGLGYGDSSFYPYVYPELGTIIYEVLNMKTFFSYKYIFNQFGSLNFYHDLSITQSFFWNKRFKISGTYEYKSNNKYSDSAYEFLFHIFF